VPEDTVAWSYSKTLILIMQIDDELKNYTDDEIAQMVAEEARHRGGISRSEAATLENLIALHLGGVVPGAVKNDEPVDAPFDPS
jgi:hypothetical protein